MYKESKGAWTTGANHVVDYSVTDARNPLGPGSSAAPFGLQGNGFSYTRLPVNGRPVPFGFGWSNRPGGFFNSVHMALIPKGP